MPIAISHKNEGIKARRIKSARTRLRALDGDLATLRLRLFNALDSHDEPDQIHRQIDRIESERVYLRREIQVFEEFADAGQWGAARTSPREFVQENAAGRGKKGNNDA